MRTIILFVAAVLFCGQAVALQQHSYKPLTRTAIGSQKVADSNNVIKEALQSPTGVVYVNGSGFFTAAKYALDNIQGDDYLQGLVINKGLQNAVLEYAEEVGCKEWRFRNAKPAADGCGEGNSESSSVEQVLFGKNGIRVEYTSKKKPVHYSVYSPSVTDRYSVWHGAHDIKGINVRNSRAETGETLLTVYLDVYKVIDGFRSDKLVQETMAIFLVVPDWSEIGNAGSESQAGKLVRKNVRILRTEG